MYTQNELIQSVLAFSILVSSILIVTAFYPHVRKVILSYTKVHHIKIKDDPIVNKDGYTDPIVVQLLSLLPAVYPVGHEVYYLKDNMYKKAIVKAYCVTFNKFDLQRLRDRWYEDEKKDLRRSLASGIELKYKLDVDGVVIEKNVSGNFYRFSDSIIDDSIKAMEHNTEVYQKSLDSLK